MKMRLWQRHLFPLVLAVVGSDILRADDWSQWRGPDRNDISKEKGLLKRWPEGGPRRVWIFKDAGLGYAGPAVVGTKLYTMGARDKTEFLIAVNTGDGKQLWSADLGSALQNDWGNGPRGTVTVDGDRVYALGGAGALICANAADGKVVWKVTMQELGGSAPKWGFTESVLVDGDKVICTPGGSKGAIAALDKATGKVIWQSKEFTDDAQYSSILARDHDGKHQYIQLTMKHVVGIGAENGDVLWQSDWLGRTAVIPTPIFNRGFVYVTSGYGVGCKLIKLGPMNQVTTVYENKVMKNHHGGVVLLGDHLYGHSDGVGWVCQKFDTGEEVWSERKKLGKGGVTCADGMLYCVEEDSGTVALVAASPKGWAESGRFRLDPQTTQRSPRGKVWTHPVVSGGKLYLRDQELLFCYDVKQ